MKTIGYAAQDGYSKYLVCREEFVLHVPDGLDLSRVAPQLGADVTVLSRCIVGSAIGGIAETQELINFCAKKNILPECEMIKIDEVNDALERPKRSDVRYRFVIDMGSLRAPSN